MFVCMCVYVLIGHYATRLRLQLFTVKSNAPHSFFLLMHLCNTRSLILSSLALALIQVAPNPPGYTHINIAGGISIITWKREWALGRQEGRSEPSRINGAGGVGGGWLFFPFLLSLLHHLQRAARVYSPWARTHPSQARLPIFTMTKQALLEKLFQYCAERKITINKSGLNRLTSQVRDWRRVRVCVCMCVCVCV